MIDVAPAQLAMRTVDDRSIGFLVAGASQIAEDKMIEAIWRQPPALGARDVAGAYVAALFSHNPRRARRFADRHGIVHAGDLLAPLLERREVRCVYVGSHPRHHAETVRAALAAGKHVLCEPPLSEDLEESRALEQMALHRGLILALNYSWRAGGAVQLLRQQLYEGTIGEVLGIRIDNTDPLPPDRQGWRLRPPFGGVLWDRLLRDVDLLAFLLLCSPAAVHAHSLQKLLGGSSEEDVMSVVRLRGGPPALVHDSFVYPHAPTCVTIWGSLGTLRAVSCQVESRGSQLWLQRGTTELPLAWAPIDVYRVGVARFLAAVRLGEAPLATALDDRRAVAAVLAAQQSLSQGQGVTLPLIR
ncbi:MAG: Gfo/Idh/MocA family oxidoreductase [Caldilinea sp.]|nr:Gfo/Idh/MocA family oxidoreductase [Caldilinea sp.]